jgi:hypothetical protein
MPALSVIESPDVMVGFSSAGSACCVWRDGAGDYIATAAHVLTGVPAGTRMRWISNDLSTSGGGTPLTSSLWLPVPGGRLDAGLVRIDDPGPFRDGGPYPSGAPLLGWEAIANGLVVQICGKHGVTTAEVSAKVPAGLDFKGHVHGRLVQFRFLHGETDAGDSGAAVISLPEQMLVGMHVARDGTRSLAVPAEDIRDAFGALMSGFDLRP